MTIKEFNQWKEDYGLVHEPNYSLPTELDCLNAFKAGQRSKQQEIDNLGNINFESDLHLTAAKEEITRLKDGMKRLLKSYNAQKSLPMSDEFNRGWVSAFSCVVEDLEKLIK